MPDPIRVVCTIRRAKGSTATMPATAFSPQGMTYRFVPTPEDDRHIAVVSDPIHLARFLSIQHDWPGDHLEKPYELADPVAVPAEAAQGTRGAAQHGALPPADPQDPPDDAGTDEAPADGDLHAMSDDALRAALERKRGKPVSPRMSRENLIMHLSEVD